MNSLRKVQLAETEQSLLHLRESLGIYHSMVGEKFVSGSRNANFQMGTWLMLLGYTEVYVDAVLDRLFLSVSEDLPVGVLTVVEKEALNSNSSWSARTQALRNIFDIPAAGFQSWQRLDAAIWIRNSIAHGSGRLTKKQKEKEAEKAKQLDVTVIDGRLHLEGSSIRMCTESCCAFIEELDVAARKFLESRARAKSGQSIYRVKSGLS